ncbi:MAG TPA: apolipoprotein N-acyltransferase [Pyrinomonadaceae bacterium]|nr:apolipoprotein N-acyltransferase [Pyrinomonadaceae bacterium]
MQLPTRVEWAAAAATALLLVLSFPNFDFFVLAWIALVPLMVVITQRPSRRNALLLGWAAGSAFFYCSCYWLTYSMIHYGELRPVVAYLLLVPGAIVIGIFPGLFALVLALAVRRWGRLAVLTGPFVWTAFEWARLGVTGQLWNALGYSQAYHPILIQPAKWGGVYAVSFLIVAANSAVVMVLLERNVRAAVSALTIFSLIGLISLASQPHGNHPPASSSVHVIALQPNVPMTIVKTGDQLKALRERHLALSKQALAKLPNDNLPRLVIWPESPMNFTYASDKAFQQWVGRFATEHHASLIFNSLEPAGPSAYYNSALMINEQGHLISQYDKIRLMPFGEYVPLPQWLPGASLITAIVGEFTPGEKYTMMPVGDYRAGVFICIESAYPWIARRLTNEGADVLINISNDGYLGPTAVMRQHLANAIFRAVENGRPVLRVTNSGLSAEISERGEITDQTVAFHEDVRNWVLRRSTLVSTFYTRHGDLFVYACTAITVVVLFASMFRSRRSFRQKR